MCNAEAASVEAAAQEWAGQVDFVGVAWTGDNASFQRFIDKYSLSFPQISDDPGTVFARFGVPAQPAFVVVKPNGDSRVLLGAVDEANLRAVLAQAAAG
ncbi:MAG: redoxin domain-containing protein [Ilumatobacteraceae bacterium]